MTIPAATDIPIFRAYVQHVLIPTLQPGEVVIYDHLSSHQDPECTRLIEQAGASVRPLPAYSPDLNPIGKMWSKVKALLRSAKARTPAALNRAIARALAAVTAKAAQGWFAARGYSISYFALNRSRSTRGRRQFTPGGCPSYFKAVPSPSISLFRGDLIAPKITPATSPAP